MKLQKNLATIYSLEEEFVDAQTHNNQRRPVNRGT